MNNKLNGLTLNQANILLGGLYVLKDQDLCSLLDLGDLNYLTEQLERIKSELTNEV